jgi:hypothetical protein
LARAITSLRVGDIGRRDLIHDLGGRVPEHSLGSDVEDLNDTLVGAVENRNLQGARGQKRLRVSDVLRAINRELGLREAKFVST